MRPSLLLVAPALLLVQPAGATPTGRLKGEAMRLIEEAVPEEGPGVSVLLLRHGHVVLRTARGRASVELGVPLRPNTRFRIGSLTKTFTAAAMLRLVAGGQVSLDDSLSRFLPDFPHGSRITLGHLISHTSGISDTWEADPTKPMTTAQVLQLIQAQPLALEPGTQWQYSNSGYMVLGAVLEKVTGKSWHEAIRSLVLAPLGLSHTSYHNDAAVIRDFASGYSLDEAGVLTRAAMTSIEGPGAAGALTSTVDDVAGLLLALQRPGFLPATQLATMGRPWRMGQGKEAPGGLGTMVGRLHGEAILEHSGGIEGYRGHWISFPDQGVIAIVLCNTDGGTLQARSLARRLGALAVGRPFPHFNAVAANPEGLAAFVGTYTCPQGPARTLSVRGGKLWVRRGEGPERPLGLAKGDLLFFPGDLTDHFQVVRDANGQVVALDAYLNGAQEPTREPRRP
jgi:CubicO group peptidase (beta-lactamase class C family)